MRATALRGSLFGLVVVSGCASVPDGTAERFKGVSGPVEWKAADVGWMHSRDGRRTRWSYTIVLRERVGTAVQFERIERGYYGQALHTSGTGVITFDRRLEGNSELRFNTSDTWGWTRTEDRPFGGVARLGSLTAEKRFIGKDASGNRVVVPVRVVLDRDFGRPSRQPSSSAESLPPRRTLESGELKALAGRWEGYYTLVDFDVPVETVIGEDGSVQFGENDPVTIRFRRSLSIRDGRAWYSGRDSGEFVLHEGGGRQVLVGHLTTAATGSAPPETMPVRLERVSGAGEAPAARTSASRGPISLGGAAQRAFETYKSDPKYTHFKAFAAEPSSGIWGRAWGFRSATGAIERALTECRQRGTQCEVYAIGDTIVAGMSSNYLLAATGRYVEQYSAIATAGVPATYKGVISTEQEGHSSPLPVIFSLVRGVTEVSGGWVTEDGQVSGVITGTVAQANQVIIRLTQQHPCRAEFTGVATISGDGTTLGGSYTGPDCAGRLVKGTFTAVRQ